MNVMLATRGGHHLSPPMSIPRCLLIWLAFCALSRAALLQVNIATEFNGEPMAFNSLRHKTASGQTISVSRLDFLMSEIALQKADGTWLSLTNWQAFISPINGRDTFTLRGLPDGLYTSLRFQVGLPKELNHSDPAPYAAGHPLNPTVNGLHWNWQGGYVFMALEGSWKNADGPLNGFSYHLATDPMLMTVELPLALDLKGDQALKLTMDAGRLIGATKLGEDTLTTHSRTGDELATQLRQNTERAFAISLSDKAITLEAPLQAHREVIIAKTAKLVPFTFPASFPRPSLPGDNPLNVEGIELGRRLFAEKRLSINNTQACSTCHTADHAFTDSRKVSVGAEGHHGRRNAMPLFNLAWKQSYFWDGRARTLRDQVLQPIQDEIEMHETMPQVVAKLSRGEGSYAPLFAAAFGSTEITADRIARALEQFLLTQLSHDSRFDRVMKNEAQFTPEEQRGFDLFHSEYDPRRGIYGADCFHCHGGPLFQNVAFANNGLDATFKDAGKGEITNLDSDRGKFAVPSLRNVALTAPYMHDGRFATLEEVVEHYNHGVQRSDTLDPNLAKHPTGGLQLSKVDQQALVAFLKTLTEEKR